MRRALNLTVLLAPIGLASLGGRSIVGVGNVAECTCTGGSTNSSYITTAEWTFCVTGDDDVESTAILECETTTLGDGPCRCACATLTDTCLLDR